MRALLPTAIVVLVAAWLVADAREIALKPGMPALANVGVPLLWKEIPNADKAHVEVRITPEQPYHWVCNLGEPFRATAVVGARAGGDGAVLTVWDCNRTPIAQVHLAAPCEQAFSFNVTGRGTYLLTLDVLDGGKPIWRLPRSFSVCPSNLRRRETFGGEQFFLGTCSYPDRQHWANDYGPGHPPDLTEQQSRELEADLTARLGMQVVRIGPLGYWVDEAKPIDFERGDACVQTLADRGLKLDLQLGTGFDWMILDKYRGVKDPKWRYPPREEPLRRFTRASVERYVKYARFIEVWNEPDNRDFWRGTPQEFVEFLRATVSEIRKVAPNAVIANGGFCFIEPTWTGIIAREIKGLTDWQAYHSHGEVPVIANALGTLRAVHAAAGYDHPVFVNTEMGYMAWRLDAEREMAATAAQKALYCWAHGNRGALLYCSREVGGPRGGDYGFLDYTFCPRFMYGAIAALVDGYAGARFSRILRENRDLHAYEFIAGDRRLVALFAPENRDLTATVKSDARQAHLVDAMGNGSAAASAQDSRLAATLYPTTLVLEGATKVEIAP
jgi:hypothetical protein